MFFVASPVLALLVVAPAAQSCLDRWRFKLVFGKQRAKLMHAPGGSQSDKDKIWGPYSYKFQIIVKVGGEWRLICLVAFDHMGG